MTVQFLWGIGGQRERSCLRRLLEANPLGNDYEEDQAYLEGALAALDWASGDLQRNGHAYPSPAQAYRTRDERKGHIPQIQKCGNEEDELKKKPRRN